MLVKLLKPHTHGGEDYPVGAKVELEDRDARWLIEIGVAEEITDQSR